MFAQDPSWTTVIVSAAVSLLAGIAGAALTFAAAYRVFMRQRSASNAEDTDSRIREAAAALTGYQSLTGILEARIRYDDEAMRAYDASDRAKQKELSDCLQDRVKVKTAFTLLCGISKRFHAALVKLQQDPGPIDEIDSLAILTDGDHRHAASDYLTAQAKQTVLAIKEVDKEIAAAKAAIPDVKLDTGAGDASPPC